MTVPDLKVMSRTPIEELLRVYSMSSMNFDEGEKRIFSCWIGVEEIATRAVTWPR